MPDLNIDLLKRLCETPGIAGREDAVRALVREEMAGLVDELQVDTLGNLIGVRRGSGGPKVMLAAHMDEIGFMVRHIDERGFIRIHPVGGFDPSRLPAQRVTVHGRDGATWRGAIGVAGKPIHLQAANEVKPPTIDDLFVDIGLDGEAARSAIDIGDMITLERTLEMAGPHIMSKALDDRVGIFIMLEALRALGDTAQAEVIAVATTQEEVGVRGATTAAYQLQPDIGIALDITPAGDFPGAPEEFVGVRLGGGVAIKVMDTTAIAEIDHPVPGTDETAIAPRCHRGYTYIRRRCKRMSDTGRTHNPASESSGTDTDEGAEQLAQMRAAVADEVANLISRLPDNAGVLELTMAEGVDPAGLQQALASLPGTEDLATLTAALNDPEALARLLAARDTDGNTPHPNSSETPQR